MPNAEDKIYIECAGGCPEHLLQFERYDEFVYVYTLLTNQDNFFKRVWIAIKYIFGYKCRYGHFDEILLSRDSVDKLCKFLKKE